MCKCMAQPWPMAQLLLGGQGQPGPLLTQPPCARCPATAARSSASGDTGPVERRPSRTAISPGAVRSAAPGVCTALPSLSPLMAPGLAQGGRKGGKGGEERGQEGRRQEGTGQEGSCPGFALDRQVFPKMWVHQFFFTSLSHHNLAFQDKVSLASKPPLAPLLQLASDIQRCKVTSLLSSLQAQGSGAGSAQYHPVGEDPGSWMSSGVGLCHPLLPHTL